MHQLGPVSLSLTTCQRSNSGYHDLLFINECTTIKLLILEALWPDKYFIFCWYLTEITELIENILSELQHGVYYLQSKDWGYSGGLLGFNSELAKGVNEWESG